MLNFYIRKTRFKNMTKQDKYQAELLLDQFKMEFWTHIILLTIFIVPIVLIAASIIVEIFFTNMSLDNMIFSILCNIAYIAYLVFLNWFLKKFNSEIQDFKRAIFVKLYSCFLTNGQALSNEDFDTIQKKDKKLHFLITNFHANGYCYGICFNILKALEKGKILFIAVKQFEHSKTDSNNYYTMHVLYLNNNWCFDTFSQRQFPLEEALKHFQGKEFKSFSFKDIEHLDYEGFREKYYTELKIWCKENDCYQAWKED